MATARSRRHEYSEATRKALVDSAVELFAKRGYAGTSLDEVAKKARVTKGALYHHFTGKLALFEAAFDAVESGVMGRLAKAMASVDEPWEMVNVGLREYLRLCLDPAVQRIVVHEAPVVMGWERWRAAEEKYSFGVVRGAVEVLIDAGEFDPAPVEELSRVLFGALTAGAMLIAGAEDQKKASADVADVVERILLGLRRGGDARAEPAGSRGRKLRRRR